ncbi:serine hydrolase domain-containing protein [Flagellimonas sp. S174]|uniref:serine hydrolase domain-containing protein n=1 Tax=Flagellimonas sp. S174 TaxID=3410790 RepID=UPI003BF560A4
MKYVKRILLVLLVVIAIVVYLNYSKLNIISGYASKYMASATYLAERDSSSIVNNDLKMPLVELAEVSLDSKNATATASVYGLMNRKAIDRKGLGSVLVDSDFDEDKNYLQPKRNFNQIEKPYPYGHLDAKDTLLPEVDYDQLNKAIALAFSNPEVQKTRTVAVLYKGYLLGEHYSEGFTKDTKILGWSMTKSLLATCYGILEHQGKLEMDWPAPIPEWKDDERRTITLNHLLRMQSGLEWEEDYSKISDVTRMLFLEDDMTIAQKEKELIAQPTEVWNYSSGTTNLLSGILRQQFRSHQEYLDFPYKNLIDKIGMHSMILEADVKGNYVGSSYAWATTRDWARFGQLYLDKGVWNGEQVFDSSWVDYITKVTQDSDGTYGAHFWLNSEGIYPDVPRDLFSCNGFQGQHVFIIPSKDLVVVRTGLAERPDFDVNGFLSEVIKSLK